MYVCVCVVCVCVLCVCVCVYQINSYFCYYYSRPVTKHSVRFCKKKRFFTVAIFCRKKSIFFSSQQGRKLINCYRNLSLLQIAETNTRNKVGECHSMIASSSTQNYVHHSTHFPWEIPYSGAAMSHYLLSTTK